MTNHQKLLQDLLRELNIGVSTAETRLQEISKTIDKESPQEKWQQGQWEGKRNALLGIMNWLGRRMRSDV